MFKNVASQICMVLAWDTSADAAKTGDAANITAQISKDAGVTAASNDTNPTELDSTDAPGIYVFDLTQAETNCDHFLLYAVSSTSNIKLEPVSIYTRPATQDANVTQISGSSTAADNAEIVFDTDFASNYDATNDVWKANVTLIEGVDATNQINSECDTALSDYDSPTKAEMDSGFAALNDPTAAEIRAEIDSNSTQLAAIVADTNELQTDDVPGLIAALNDLSSADVNAACDIALSDYDAVVPADLPSNFADLAITATTGRVTVGTNNDKTGYGLADDAITASKFDESTAFPLASADSGATQVARVGADGDTLETLSDQIDAIVEDTNELQIDWTNGGRLDLILDELTAQGDTNEGKIDVIDGIVDTILVDTNELQTDLTNGGRLDLIFDELTSQGDTNEGKLDTIDSVVDSILVDTGTTIDDKLDQIMNKDSSLTFDPATDSLEAIRDRGDAAWTTGAGGTPPQLLQSTTIATLASQTSFTLTAGSSDDDVYNGAIIVVTDQVTAEQKAVGEISDYTGSTKTVTLTADPGIFTMAVGDTVYIIAALGAAGSGASAAEVWGYGTRALTDKVGFGLADDAITSAKYDESTAFPLASADSGATQIARVGADGDTLETLSDQLDAITAAAIADAVWDEARGDHLSAGSFGQSLQLIRSGTAQAGGSTSITLDASASSITNFYINCTVFVISGTGAYQTRRISAYNGTTKVATVANAWNTNPDNTSIFIILPRAELSATISSATIASIVDAVWDESTSGHTTGGTFGEQCKTDIDAILDDTNELQTDDVPGLIAALNNLSSAEANAACDTALADYDPPTKAELDSGLAALNDPTAAEIRAEIDSNSTQLAAIVEDTGTTLDGKLNTIDGIVDSILVDTGTTLDTKLDQMMHKDSGETFDQAYDSLEAIRDRGDSAWATGIDGIIKNTALDNFAFLMVDETDGYTPETGLTVTVQLSKNSGAFSDADQQSSIYEIGNGMYSIDFTANDMNADFIVVKCTATGARNRYIAFKTET